jgi:hypothetical protein
MNRKNVIAAVWLIGLGILFMVDYIWPGILILIGITMIVNATMRGEPTVMPPPTTPQSPLRQTQGTAPSTAAEPVEANFIEAIPYEPPTAEPVATSTSSMTAAAGEPLPAILASEADRLYLSSQLPEKCPACDAPLRANAKKLAWHSDNSVSCMFCGYRMTVKAG